MSISFKKNTAAFAGMNLCGRIFRPALRRGVLIRRAGSYGAWQACKACFRIPCAGDIPTPEEWLRYAVEKIKADGRGDLLYLPDDWEG